MTFTTSAWAIDGARSGAALARRQTYATGGGADGVVRGSDLKVLPLSVPGSGIRITSGGGLVLNGYQSTPNETYVVNNPSTHTVNSGEMPPASAGIRYYLVCVVVGDPEFSQTGHPFMPGSLDEQAALDYSYVRPVILEAQAGFTDFGQLNLPFPGLALARLEVPSNTSTITADMIKDVRHLAQPRSDGLVVQGAPATNIQVASPNYVDWPDFTPTIKIPAWATHIGVITTLSNYVKLVSGVAQGRLRTVVGNGESGTLVGADSVYDIGDQGRYTSVFSATGAIAALAGRSGVPVRVQATRDYSSQPNEGLYSYGGMQVVHDIRFYERPI